jgi:gas vesicle protein
MDNYANRETGSFGERERVLIGALIGGFAGAAAIFIMAARSINPARAEIHLKPGRPRERASGFAHRKPGRKNLEQAPRTDGNMTVHVA